MLDNYWDENAYTRIVAATYDQERDLVTVSFADGDTVAVAAWRLFRSTNKEPDWERLRVVDNYHINVPVKPGTGDLGSGETDVPGFTIRSMTDPIFAADLARHAAESARSGGERLRELRERRGLTRGELAARRIARTDYFTYRTGTLYGVVHNTRGHRRRDGLYAPRSPAR